MSNQNKPNHPFQKNKRELATTMNDVGADMEVEAVVEPEVITELDALLNTVTKKPKPPEKVQVSLYIEPAVAKEFDKFGKKHGKGAKSELINNFLKKALQVK